MAKIAEFIVVSRVRQLALDTAKVHRYQPFENVGASFLRRIDAAVKSAVIREVIAHPSRGKTLL